MKISPRMEWRCRKAPLGSTFSASSAMGRETLPKEPERRARSAACLPGGDRYRLFHLPERTTGRGRRHGPLSSAWETWFDSSAARFAVSAPTRRPRGLDQAGPCRRGSASRQLTPRPCPSMRRLNRIREAKNYLEIRIRRSAAPRRPVPPGNLCPGVSGRRYSRRTGGCRQGRP